MDIGDWKKELEPALAAALLRGHATIGSSPVERLDIGVFPWHGTMELSFLLSEDVADDVCEPNDVAAWPLYNVSNFSEGKWPEAKMLFQYMQETWEQDTRSSESFFYAVAAVAGYASVADIIRQFTHSAGFAVTLYDPDRRGSSNYCA